MWNNLETLLGNCANTELSGTESNTLINVMPLLVLVALIADLLHLNLIEVLLR